MHPQRRGPYRHCGDRVGVVGVGLAVVSGVEEPDPGGELGRDVDHVFAVFEESLCQWAAGAVAAFDRPEAVGPGLRILAHRGVAGPVRGEPARPQQLFVLVDNLDRRGQLVGIDPDDHVL